MECLYKLYCFKSKLSLNKRIFAIFSFFLYNENGDKMSIFIIIGIITIILSIIIITFIINYQKMKWAQFKINKGEESIREMLEIKYNILKKYLFILKKYVDINENDIIECQNINIQDSIHLLNTKANKISKNLYSYMEKNEKLLKEKDIKEINKDLNNNYVNLNGLINYYNENIAFYNNLYKTFPSNIVAKILRYQEKEFLEKEQEEQLKIFEK